MLLFLLLSALLGHAFLCVGAYNRAHAAAMPRWTIRLVTSLCLACMVVVPAAFGRWFAAVGGETLVASRSGQSLRPESWAGLCYLGACWGAAGIGVGRAIWRGLAHRPPDVLRFHRTRSLAVTASPDATPRERRHHFLAHLPGNEILQLEATERTIDLPRLPPALDGLSIVHLSDLHFTGRVGKAYFRQVVRRVNEMEPDLVALTGDLVDKTAYIDWIPDTLGNLVARHGVYFVLGNHDVRCDTARLRQTLTRSGLVDLGARWIRIDVRGEAVVLAGNELPWLAPAADMRDCPARTAAGPLRIVLAHSPDQLNWARRNDADLLLVGHTHGGQIRLPLLGPIVSPTRRGVKYASGLFYAPPTVMHVTRGVSAEVPLRWNCLPEIARLVLHAPPQTHGESPHGR